MVKSWILIGLLMLLGSGGDTRRVEEAEIKRLVEQHVRGRLAAVQQDVRIEFRHVPGGGVNIPKDARLYVVDEAASRLRGNVILPVEVLHNNRVERTFLVSLRIRTFGQVLVATGKVEKQERGETLPILVEQRETTTLPADVLTSPDQLKGNRTKQIIQRGAVLRESMLEQIPIVHQGSIVTVVVKTGSVVVRTQAVARDDGVHGARVRVQKLGSHDILSARVIDEQTVELLQE